MFKKSKTLKALREKLEGGMHLIQACKSVGLRSSYTLFSWRKRKMIDNYIHECIRRGGEKRTDAVEDGFFKSLMEGRGSAAGYELYLTNRRPEKWQKRSVIVNNTNTNVVKVTVNPVKDMRDEELDGIINRAFARG